MSAACPRRSYESAASAAAKAAGLDVARVLDPAGSRRARSTRQLAAYLAAISCDVPLAHLAPVVGVWPNALREGFRRIEDRRDDPAFDHKLDRLERQVRRSMTMKEIAA